jgi:membrane protein required for colicin V production
MRSRIMTDVFNGLDWAILVMAVLLLAAGLWKGLIRLVFAVFSVAAAIVLACLSTGMGSQALMPLIRNPALAAMASFVVVFFFVLIVLGLVGRLLSKAVRLLGLGWVDRLGGAAVGLAVAALVVGALFLAFDLAGVDRSDLVRESALAPAGMRIAGVLDGVFPKEVRRMIEKRRKDFEEMEERIDEGRRRLKDLPPEVRDRISEEI